MCWGRGGRKRSVAAKISGVLEIFQESQMLNFQELCELVVKHSHFLKWYKVTIKWILIKAKIINTQNLSLSNYFATLNYFLCPQGNLYLLHMLTLVCYWAFLPNYAFNDIIFLTEISHGISNGTIYARKINKHYKSGFFFLFQRAGSYTFTSTSLAKIHSF